MVFWIIGIKDYTTLLHDVNTDFPPYGALWIRCPDCSSLSSPPNDIKKCDPLDADEFKSILAIVNANLTGHHGDVRFFICSMISAIRIRTGEQGDKVLP
jgi:hypothetical protein